MKKLVLIHGFLGSKKDWDFLSQSKDFQGWELYPFEIKRTGNLDLVCLDLLDFFEKKGLDKATLWGYSLGGRVALKFYELFPHYVNELVLESCAHSALQSSPEKWQEQNRVWADKIRSLEPQAFLEEWYSQDLFKSLKNSPNYQETLKIRTAQIGDGARLWSEHWAQILIDASQATNPLLKPTEIHIPTLVLLGEKDTKYVSLWSPFVDKNENLDIRIVPQAGHVIHMENKNALLKVTSQWLNRKG